MKTTTLLIAFSLLHLGAKGQDYISYYLIHVGVDHTLKEHQRQKGIKEKQALVVTGEEINSSRMARLKDQYKRIMERLNKLNLLFDGSFMAAEAYPALTAITRSQAEIMDEVRSDPNLIPIALQSEIDLLKKAQSIIMFITGLVLTYGDINQMKPGDRKMLLNHSLDEINLLSAVSTHLLGTIRNIKYAEQLRKAEAQAWVNRDREIINEIINNSKKLF